ncbi:biotin transporter BioY [Nocardioides pacificus]
MKLSTRNTPGTTNAPAPASAGRDLALVAIFAGVIAALGVIPAITPLGGSVPITAQSMGIMLAGALLGPRRATMAVVLFLALVAIGLPLLAGGRGGLGVFAGPSVGYLLGWPIAAFVIGWLTQVAGAPYRLWTGIAANLLGGVVVLYAFGVPGTAIRTDTSLWAALVAAWVFIPGDIAKAIITGIVARGVHAAYPGLIRERRSASPASTAAKPAA